MKVNLKPLHTTGKLKIYSVSTDKKLVLPIIEEGVSAGFPSPAADFLESKIDLNEELIKNPATTFIAFTEGFSMQGAGIGHRDILIIDKSLEPRDGKIAVCFIDGDYTLKRLKIDNGVLWLMPENEKYQPIKITEDNDFMVWGIVTYSIMKH